LHLVQMETPQVGHAAWGLMSFLGLSFLMVNIDPTGNVSAPRGSLDDAPGPCRILTYIRCGMKVEHVGTGQYNLFGVAHSSYFAL
jgi:hypothetical protein